MKQKLVQSAIVISLLFVQYLVGQSIFVEFGANINAEKGIPLPIDDPLTIWTGFLAIGGILPIIVILLLALWQKNALFNSKGMLTLLGGTLCAFGFAILGSCSAIIALLIAPVNIKKYI